MSSKPHATANTDIVDRMISVIVDPATSPATLSRAVELIRTDAVLNDRSAQAKDHVDLETFVATIAVYDDVTNRVVEAVERHVQTKDQSELHDVLADANTALIGAITALHHAVDQSVAKRRR